jgi:intracellular sulfur oxidation DsrE/DsrF family protein
MKMKVVALVTSVILLSSICSNVKAAEFADGPVIFDYGKHAPVQQNMKLDNDAVLKVVFNVGKAGKDGAVNRGFDSVARFLNMHVANGIPAKNIHLVIVVHGSASSEMLNAKAFQTKYDKQNPNIELISTLLKNNVELILCGQSAAYHQIANQDMIEGVDMALSAMTAHAILATKGYSQNPF